MQMPVNGRPCIHEAETAQSRRSSDTVIGKGLTPESLTHPPITNCSNLCYSLTLRSHCASSAAVRPATEPSGAKISRAINWLQCTIVESRRPVLSHFALFHFCSSSTIFAPIFFAVGLRILTSVVWNRLSSTFTYAIGLLADEPRSLKATTFTVTRQTRRPACRVSRKGSSRI